MLKNLWINFAIIILLFSSCSFNNQKDSKIASAISLAPSITENFIYLNKINILKGVTIYDTYKEVKDIPKVGGLINPNITEIAKLKTDAIFILPYQYKYFKNIKNTKICIVNQSDLTSINYELKKLAYLLNLDSNKVNFSKKIQPKNKFSSTKSAIVIVHLVPKSTLDKHYYYDYYLAGEKSYYKDILKLFNINIIGDLAYYKINAEKLLKMDYDLIFNFSTTPIVLDSTYKENKEFFSLNFQSKKIFNINDKFATIPGPISVLKLINTIDSLCFK